MSGQRGTGQADPDSPFLREMVISFGVRGYVTLFEIEGDGIVTILAVRHQREEDYHSPQVVPTDIGVSGACVIPA